mmetsp:Transcript_21579/g.40302  ORF Transcript_21579/g.40302 Transcript_21579/m.40302 type:complete len:172 (-) Transcript_21579:335-850(-)
MASYGNVMGGRLSFKGSSTSTDASREPSNSDDSKYQKKRRHDKKSKRSKHKKSKKEKRKLGTSSDDFYEDVKVNENDTEGRKLLDAHSRKKQRSEVPICSNTDGGDDDEDRYAGLTPAQRKFEQVKSQREMEQINKMISKTHRQKIDEFNDKLARLSEHHDIPKVSAAGNG